MPRLSAFIHDHAEEILTEWETFARTLPVADSMDIAALRDHAKEMLGVIARDLARPQTSGEQSDKAQGKSDAGENGPPVTAAQEHGAARAVSGFTVAQMLSELRALRASVIRLWTAHKPQLLATDLEDMIRFNEAIDQAIAESVTQYSDDITESKERFLAILGHDLRNPLGAIIMSAQFMLDVSPLGGSDRAMVERIGRSAGRMNQMVSDLLDFTRTRFGGDGIPIERAEMDVARMVEEVATEVVARYPSSPVTVTTDGALRGYWDSARLAQALTNIVANAVQHGTRDSPIAVAAHGTPHEIVISVHNEGPVIRGQELGQLFRVGAPARGEQAQDVEHLGLGLFIVDRIVAAHGGTIDVQSTPEGGTTFTVHLPRVDQDIVPGRRDKPVAEHIG